MTVDCGGATLVVRPLSDRVPMTCDIEGCEKPIRSSRITVCEMHYYRMRRTGSYTLNEKPRPLSPAPCAVEECGRRARHWAEGQHVCLMHKKRWDRNGHFAVVHFKSPPRAGRGICVIDHCDAIDDGPHGLCKMHKTRLDRHGDPLIFIPQADRNVPRGARHPAWTGDDATYWAIHQRVRARHGSPRKQACIDCGRRAAHWSYNHDDPSEKLCELGPYSLSLESYLPRCVSCHKRFDLAYLRKTA